MELVTEPGYSQPATVRISNVRLPDVRSVHDLGGHTAIDDAFPFSTKVGRFRRRSFHLVGWNDGDPQNNVTEAAI